jgi:hypothetical protein
MELKGSEGKIDFVKVCQHLLRQIEGAFGVDASGGQGYVS